VLHLLHIVETTSTGNMVICYFDKLSRDIFFNCLALWLIVFVGVGTESPSVKWSTPQWRPENSAINYIWWLHCIVLCFMTVTA